MVDGNHVCGGFWSSEKLQTRLPGIITAGYKPERIETASYAMTIGGDVYISPAEKSSDAMTQTIRSLAMGECFAIPPGQFANLVTAETVDIPPDAIGFISMKFSVKWHGLVNISGFHVDPGYRGTLVFVVFNAGPAPVHLRVGQECFLLWLASLDQKTNDFRKKPGQERLDPNHIIAGEVPSYAGLRDRIRAVEDAQKYYSAVAAILISVSLIVLASVLSLVVYLGPPYQVRRHQRRARRHCLSAPRRRGASYNLWGTEASRNVLRATSCRFGRSVVRVRDRSSTDGSDC